MAANETPSSSKELTLCMSKLSKIALHVVERAMERLKKCLRWVSVTELHRTTSEEKKSQGENNEGKFCYYLFIFGQIQKQYTCTFSLGSLLNLTLHFLSLLLCLSFTSSVKCLWPHSSAPLPLLSHSVFAPKYLSSITSGSLFNFSPSIISAESSYHHMSFPICSSRNCISPASPWGKPASILYYTQRSWNFRVTYSWGYYNTVPPYYFLKLNFFSLGLFWLN